MLIILLLISPYLGKGHVILSKSWIYNGNSIGYEVARNVQSPNPITISEANDATLRLNEADFSQKPVLLLNGFGVGTFHQHRLMPYLLPAGYDPNTSPHRVVYGVDYLGQGRSWPIDCQDGNSDNEKNLIYSIDTWIEQIIHFIEGVIIPNHCKHQKEGDFKLHLIGNSVGGLIAVLVALKRPDLIDSICLLNATPVWGLNLPGWSGHLPPPPIPRLVGRYLFDKIRDRVTIEKYLMTAYANFNAFGEDLISQIRNCTEGNGGHAAFASILWAPKATFPGDKQDFYSNLSRLQCDVLLLFGKNDSWCSPPFAKRMLHALMERKTNVTQRYIELDNVGHCPNHESPSAVGTVFQRWTNSTSRSCTQLLDEERVVFPETWANITAREVNHSEAQLNGWERLITSIVGQS